MANNGIDAGSHFPQEFLPNRSYADQATIMALIKKIGALRESLKSEMGELGNRIEVIEKEENNVEVDLSAIHKRLDDLEAFQVDAMAKLDEIIAAVQVTVSGEDVNTAFDAVTADPEVAPETPTE